MPDEIHHGVDGGLYAELIRHRRSGRREYVEYIARFQGHQLVHIATAPQTEHFYAVAGLDEGSGNLVIKAISAGQGPICPTLSLHGVEQVKPGDAVTVLTSSGVSGNNSLDEPGRVVPVETQLKEAGREFSHGFPVRSFSLLRLRTR